MHQSLQQAILRRRGPIMGSFQAPASKPDTQRAMVLAALARGTSTLLRPLASRETAAMAAACRMLGAKLTDQGERLSVEGLGLEQPGGGQGSTRYVWAGGSALIGRLFTTLGAATADRIVVDGNCNLRSRPFAPLFAALAEKGVRYDFFDGPDRLPCAAASTALPGGHFKIATSVSSQFATALLLPAPLARTATTLELEGPAYSLPYIRQSLAMMRRFGVPVLVDKAEREIGVPAGGGYRAQTVAIGGDFTSASYLFGAAFVTRGRIAVGNLDADSLQGERAITDILAALGAAVAWREADRTVTVDCTALPEEVDVALDLRDCPNILPTVAAMAATIPGRVVVSGARLTQFHKSPRVSAMAAELAKVEVPIRLLHMADGTVDGIEVRGRSGHCGGAVFSSHGDHRIYMSLVLLALAGERPSTFADPIDTSDSFPDFSSALALEGGEAMPRRLLSA